jgi:hypothetical protein
VEHDSGFILLDVVVVLVSAVAAVSVIVTVLKRAKFSPDDMVRTVTCCWTF